MYPNLRHVVKIRIPIPDSNGFKRYFSCLTVNKSIPNINERTIPERQQKVSCSSNFYLCLILVGFDILMIRKLV